MTGAEVLVMGANRVPMALEVEPRGAAAVADPGWCASGGNTALGEDEVEPLATGAAESILAAEVGSASPPLPTGLLVVAVELAPEPAFDPTTTPGTVVAVVACTGGPTICRESAPGADNTTRSVMLVGRMATASAPSETMEDTLNLYDLPLAEGSAVRWVRQS